MRTGRHAAPRPHRSRAGRLRTVAPAVLLLAVGLLAVACLLTVDELGAGGRVVAALVGLWGLVVGASGVRHGLRPGGP